MDKAEHIKDLVKGAIVGHLIGDALGYPYTNKKVKRADIDMIVGPDGEDPGTYQAPGALSLCTIASINECNGVILDDIMERFNDFRIAGFLGASEDYSDLSETTIQAIKNHTNGMPPDRCGLREDDFNDNECLARILPVGLYFATDPVDTLIEQAHNICKLTHAQIKSQVTCAIYCLIVKTVLLEKSEKVFDLLGDYYKTKKMDLFSAELKSLKNWKNGSKIVKEADGGRSVEDCFWSAWAAYSQGQEKDYDFRLCVTSAISLGNDANSVGAVTGGLTALTIGLQGIPNSWQNTITLSGEVMGVITTFADKIAEKVNV